MSSPKIPMAIQFQPTFPWARTILLGCNTHPLVFEKSANGRGKGKGRGGDKPQKQPEPLLLSNEPIVPQGEDPRGRLGLLLAALATGSLGVGMGSALLSSKRDRTLSQPLPSFSPTDVPYPVRAPEEEVPEALPKLAASKNVLGFGKTADRKPVTPFSLPWWLGAGASSPLEVPWAIPGAIAATTLPAMIGSSLVNRALHRKMKEKQEQELTEAQQAYEKSMLGMYDPEKVRDMPEKISMALDGLYDLYEKQASEEDLRLRAKGTQAAGKRRAHEQKLREQRKRKQKAQQGTATTTDAEAIADALASQTGANQAAAAAPSAEPAASSAEAPPPPPPKPVLTPGEMGMIAGPVATGMGLSGLLGLYAGYKFMENRKQENLMRGAIEQRARLRAAANPDPLLIRPVPRPVKPAPEEEEAPALGV